jgi:hypothetical protein
MFPFSFRFHSQQLLSSDGFYLRVCRCEHIYEWRRLSFSNLYSQGPCLLCHSRLLFCRFSTILYKTSACKFKLSNLCITYFLVHISVLFFTFYNVIFQHPVALCKSDLGVSAPSVFNVVRCSFIRQYFTTCFGLNGYPQAYRLLYFRTLLLTVVTVFFLLLLLRPVVLIVWVARGCFSVMCNALC